MQKTLLVFFLITLPLLTVAQSRFRLTVSVLNVQTDAPVAGASVLILDTGIGTVTDLAGGFSLPLPKGNQTVQVSSQGFETQQRTVTARADLPLQFRLADAGVFSGVGPQRTPCVCYATSCRYAAVCPHCLSALARLRTLHRKPVSNGYQT